MRLYEVALLTALHIPPAALMQFMGDQPKPRGKDALSLLYELLKVSQKRVCQDLEHSSRLGPSALSPPAAPRPLAPIPVFQNTVSSKQLMVLLFWLFYCVDYKCWPKS